MVTRPLVIVLLCVGLFIIIDTLVPKVIGMRTMNDFRMEDQRTHKRRNYIFERAKDKEMLGNLENVGSYDTDSAEPGRNPDELPALIFDYGNMIDDVILLDKSVETRTRKRGNIKLEKHSNQVIPDVPCNCKVIRKYYYLGRNTFPRHLDIGVCDINQENGCVSPYKCQEIYYDVPILRKRMSTEDNSITELLPQNLNWTWVAEMKPISVGCECKRDYYTYN